MAKKYLDSDGLAYFCEQLISRIPQKISQLQNNRGFITANDIAAKADLDSPTFTGTPKAPTASTGTSTTQIATTAFVSNYVPSKVKNQNSTALSIWTGTQTAYDAITSKSSTTLYFVTE